MICKLADFSDSWASYLQTQTLASSHTNQVDRGTPVFVAPELHWQPSSSVSLEDKKPPDIWAYGLIMYCLLNPDVDHPHQPVFVEKGYNESIDTLKLLLSDKQLPKPQPKYEFLQESEWGQVIEAFETCAKFDPEMRPLASELLPIFSVDQSKASLNIVHLVASQSTVLEQMDHALAVREGGVQAVGEFPAVIAPENDGTNACVFLCLAICNRFLATESMT